MNRIKTWFVLPLVASAFAGGAQAATTVLLDDTFTTGTRGVQNLPKQSAWYASSADRLTVQSGALEGVMEGSSRIWLTYFTDGAPVSIAEGENLRVAMDFEVTMPNAGNENRGLRIGLFNYAGGTRVAEDGISSSGANGAGVTGYLLSMNFAQVFGVENPLQIRRRMGDAPSFTANDNLMGSVPSGGLYSDTLGQGGGSAGSPGFQAGVVYTLEIIVENSGGAAVTTFRVSNAQGWSIEATATDAATPVLAFDALAIRPENETRTAERFRIHRLLVETTGEAVDPVDPVDPGEPGEAVVLLDDTWAAGTRTAQNLPEQSAWFASSTERLTAASGELAGVMDGSSRLWMTYFTDAAPVQLAEGDRLRVELEFVAEDINTGNENRGLRIGLFNYANGTRVTEDGISSSGANGAGVTGYLLNMNFAPSFGVENPLQIRRRMGDASAHASNDNLMGSVPSGGLYSDTLGQGGGAAGSVGFLNGVTYFLEIIVENKGGAAEVTYRFSNSAGWSIEATATDAATPVLAFDALAIRPENELRTAGTIRMRRLLVEVTGEGHGDPGDPGDPGEPDEGFPFVPGSGLALVEDTWAAGTRSVQNLPNQTAWYASSGQRLTASAGSMQGILEGSSRLWLTYFTDGDPVRLDDGEGLRVTVDFTPQGVVAENTSRGLRVGLFNYENGTRVAEDGISSSGANGAGVVGYLLNTNFGTSFGVDNPMQLRRRMGDDPAFAASDNLMGSVPGGGIYSDTLASGGGAAGAPAFVSDEAYTLEITVYREGDTAHVRYRVSDGQGWSAEVSYADTTTAVFAFDALAIRPDTTSADSFTFTRFAVEYFGEGVVPVYTSLWAGIPGVGGSHFRWTDLGWIWDGLYPWVYVYGIGDWICVVPGGASLQSFFGIFGSDGEYFWSGEAAGSWYFDFNDGDWFPWFDEDEPIHGATPLDPVETGDPVVPVDDPVGEHAGPAGYATVAAYGIAGVTGGKGGPLVRVNTVAEFQAAASRSGPVVILIESDLTGPAMVSVRPNKTILGAHPGPHLRHIGIELNNTHNVIIRNLRMSEAPLDLNDSDLIRVVNDSHHIWIDHCDLSNKDPFEQTNKNLYDGLIDITNGSDLVTVSWTRLHNHWKFMLIGSSDSGDTRYNDHLRLRVTIHHCEIANPVYTSSRRGTRVPSVRFGSVHIFNNVYANLGEGVHSRNGAKVRLEENVFDNVRYIAFSKNGGMFDVGHNLLLNNADKDAKTYPLTDFLPPYDYSHVLIAAEDVGEAVLTRAGTGVIDPFAGLP